MSLWEKYIDKKTFKSLEKDIKVDTLIIGGGITGLTTLYYLRNFNFSIALVDASQIGLGITKNTTGKLTFLQGAVYTDLVKNVGKKTAIKYLQSQKYAISLIKEIINQEKIDCDLDYATSFVYALNDKDVKKLKFEKDFLKENNIIVAENEYDKSFYNISVKETYVFNPVKYLNSLKRILKNNQIYENTKVEKINYMNKKFICYTHSQRIIAKNVIIACHYPFFIFPFCLPLKSHIEKSYLIACKTEKNKHTSGITVSNPGFSWRYYQDGDNIYKIYLGESHLTAFKPNVKENFQKVKDMFQISNEDIVAMWSNVDIITDDKMPYIGEIKKNLYIATGFNTWGMTNGILAAKIISDSLLNKRNLYADLFQIKRVNLYKFKSFFSNTLTSIVAFLGSKKIKKNWYTEKIKFKKIKGKSVAIYTDNLGKKYIVYTTCPHLKCSLIFNELEKTWDCPCHSSRFSLDGKCIKGPSKYDISFKK